nr:hypothetical protein [Lachnospiraceae bacterium]
MKYIDINISDTTLLFRVEALSDEYKEGIIDNFHAYVEKESKDEISHKNGTIFVPEGLITDEYINIYLNKTEKDYSAKDCAILAIKRFDEFLPISEMSVESLEKCIRNTIDNLNLKKKAYVKRINKKNVVCVDGNTAKLIIQSREVVEYVQSQAKKAEKRDIHKDEVEWRAYEFAKQKLARIDAFDEETDSFGYGSLSNDTKTKLLIEAIYKRMFTVFDFDKYEEYLSEMESLEEDWDFGKRYQELFEIFNSPDYKGEFYKNKNDDVFLDALA